MLVVVAGIVFVGSSLFVQQDSVIQNKADRRKILEGRGTEKKNQRKRKLVVTNQNIKIKHAFLKEFSKEGFSFIVSELLLFLLYVTVISRMKNVTERHGFYLLTVVCSSRYVFGVCQIYRSFIWCFLILKPAFFVIMSTSKAKLETFYHH